MPYKDIASPARVTAYAESQSVEIPITLNHLPSELTELSTDFYAHNHTKSLRFVLGRQ